MGVEAGAALEDAGEVAVADNLGLRIGLLEVFEQEPEGGLLLGSTGVDFTATVVFAADVADTDGMLVVVLDMGTGILLGTARMDAAILIDDPVVAAAGPALGLVPVVDVLDGDLLGRIGGGAVDDNPLDILHRVHVFHIHTDINVGVTQKSRKSRK